MQLSLQNFSSLVESMAASVQGAASTLMDLTVGSVLRALLEASASVALWLQYLLLQVLTMTRLSSSVATDADSWVGDFGMTRLPASAASGIVTMSSFNPGAQSSTITDGMTVRLSDGSQSFAVVGGPYVRAIGVGSVDVQVQALQAGVSGNVQAGAVNMLGTAIPGIDTVSNPAALSGGTAAETDPALRLRFVNYINTRAQATEQAIGYAVSSVAQGLSYVVQENVTAAGVAMPGNVHVVVDDGSGAPPAILIAQVAAAIDPVRPVGTTISVAGPVAITVSITATLTILSDVDSGTVQTAASTAVEAYVNGLGVGQALRYSRLPGLCYASSDAIVNVQAVTLNGGDADVGGGAGSVVRTQVVGFTVQFA